MKGKRCNSCKEVKPWRELVRNIKYPDGYLPLCKKCKAVKQKIKKKDEPKIDYGGEWLGDTALYL